MQRAVQQSPVSLGGWRNARLTQQQPQGQHTSRPLASSLCAASSGRGTTDEFERRARQFASNASQSFKRFAEEQQLKEKAERLQQQAERLSQEASEKAKATFDEADRKMSLRLRARNLWLDLKVRYPKWRRELTAFVESPLGKVTGVLLLLVALYTGALLRLVVLGLNVFFLAVWLSPLLLPLAMRSARRKMEEEAVRQAAAEADAQSSVRGSPFEAFMQGARQRRGWYAPPEVRRGWGGKASSSKNGQKSPQQEDGPIIDAQWTTLDD